MYEWLFGDLNYWQLLLLALCAILVGINKTGIPGIGPLPVVLMTLVFPAKLSSGGLLIMLGITDIMSVTYYRRSANWHEVFRLLPWAVFGLLLGWLVVDHVNDAQMRPLIGLIILGLVVVNQVRQRYFNDANSFPQSWWFAMTIGLLAGITTMIANAAGPVMAIYLLVMRLPKTEYMGTCAWYFLIMNWIKIPMFVAQGRITLDVTRSALAMIPCMLLGAILGILILKKIPQKLFEIIIQVLIVLTALKLCYDGLALF